MSQGMNKLTAEYFSKEPYRNILVKCHWTKLNINKGLKTHLTSLAKNPETSYLYKYYMAHKSKINFEHTNVYMSEN
jgi:hypothetical protein